MSFMSKLAGEHYGQIADNFFTSGAPPILDGEPRVLVAPGERLESGLATQRFTEFSEGLDDFVLDGVLGAIEARGQIVTPARWQIMRGWPRRTERSIAEYAASHVEPYCANWLAEDSSSVYLEALTREEVGVKPLNRLTTDMITARSPEEASAQAILLARILDAKGECRASFLTILWGRLLPRRDIAYQGVRKDSSSVRYFGAPLLRQELAGLPPLER
jgi:hypothetical protein